MDYNKLTEKQKEALGLRLRSTSIYESEYEYIDEVSGEILRSEKKSVSKVSAEPDFIKVYYKVMMSFADIKKIPAEFLLAISSFFTYTNSGSPMRFITNRMTRESICKELGIKDGMYKCYLHRCCEQGVLFPIQGYRGTYEVNPWLIAKGRWDSIKSLQANFDFVNGKWHRLITDPPEEVSVGPNPLQIEGEVNES